MAQYLTTTAYRFCTEGESQYSLFQQNQAAYMWIARNWQEDHVDYEGINIGTFRAILHYMTTMKAAPKSLDAMLQFIQMNPKMVAEFERSDIMDMDINTLMKEYESDIDWDDAVLFESLLNKARTNWARLNFAYAANIALGSCQLKEKGMEGQTGTTAAIQWLRGALSKDFRQEAPVVAGVLAENIPTVLAGLEERLNPAMTTGRFKLGLPHIDDKVVVGRQNLRYIGIVGMSGDGKTTLTNFITYNWLLQGAHILYVSTEHTPQEIWEFMCFLHASHDDYDFTIPSLNDWENQNVTQEEQTNMTRILCDIQSRKNLPGLLDVQTFRDWETIKDYLEVNHKQNKYDTLVIDYIARLDVPGDQKYRDKAVGKMIHDGQGLTRTWDANRGIILLTPIQVNREGSKAAMKAEEGDARYNLNAISQNSEYQHDLDLCLSVWSDDDMKMTSKVEIQVLKKRKGKMPPTEQMNLDPNTGAFEYDIPGVSKSAMHKAWDKTIDDKTMEDMVLSTTLDLGHNADVWGR